MNAKNDTDYLNVFRILCIGIAIGLLISYVVITRPVLDEWERTIDALERAYAALDQCVQLCAAQGFELNCTIVPDDFGVVQL